MRFLRSTLIAAAALALSGGAAALEVPCSEHSDTRLAAMSDDGIGFTSALGLADGRYALPETSAPTQLVVMFHGHGNDSCSWRKHLQDAAARGAVTFAIDYVRQTPSENYGWFMREAARDSIAAAKYFLAAYPTITTVFAMGISMGGNASGLAVASPDAVRLDGTTPLFDYWVDVEGVNNLTEEYLVARAVAVGVSDAALAQREIEEENGGALEQAPEAYAELTNVSRAPEMSDLRGAVVVHGLDDGLVTTDQSPQMAAALDAVGVPTHLYTVVMQGDGENGTTASCIPFSSAGLPCPTMFAGHGWEGSETQLVITTGFGRLWSLMAGAQVEPGETVVGLNYGPEPRRTALLAAGCIALIGLARRRRRVR